ncbi:hypothetical protein JL721_8416 [Aureococcus anophagefferens]|nr:hypothetical protein JL721_8416 [Aureococcus anophagefferens]
MLRRAARHVRINARRHPVGPLPRGLATPSSSKDDGTSGTPPPWRQIAILSGSSFVANAGFGCIIPVLPSLSESLSLGAVGVGVILSAPAAARVVLNVRLGALADEIGRRPLMIAGSALGAAGTFATGSAGSLLELVPARLLAGAGSAATLAGAQAYMADVTEGRGDRGKLLGVQQAAGTGIAASDADAAADADTRQRLAAAWRGPLPPLLAMQLAQYLGYACHLSVVPLRAVDVMAASPGDIGVLFSTVSAVAIFYAAMIAWGLGASLMAPRRGHLRGVAPPKARRRRVLLARRPGRAFLCGPLAYGALADALSPSAAIFASSACSAAR